MHGDINHIQKEKI